MNFKISLMALGAMCLVAFGASTDTQAQSATKESKKKQTTSVTVKKGDTLSSIADKHNTSYVKLFNANKKLANPDVINVGDKIRLPKTDEKLPNRYAEFKSQIQAQVVAQAPVVQAPVAAAAPVVAETATTYTTQSFTSAPVNSNSYYVGNGMWCTDYVHAKRPDVAIYGNAGYNWISAAQAEGKSTGTAPRAGAVAVMDGHVAYVESVNSDGSYVVSEMGWNYQAGNYNKRTVQPGAFGGFIY